MLDGRGEEVMRVGGEGWDREKSTKKGKKVGEEEEIQKLKCHARSLLFFGKSQPAIPDNFNARANFCVRDIHTLPHDWECVYLMCIPLYPLIPLTPPLLAADFEGGSKIFQNRKVSSAAPEHTVWPSGAAAKCKTR